VYFVLSSCCYSTWLLREGRIDEAWRTLGTAKERLRIAPYCFPYLEFSLKESEALAHKAQWELSKAVPALVKCFRELETAAGLAEGLNLNQRARMLRELQPS
jgi:hypothetical protein